MEIGGRLIFYGNKILSRFLSNAAIHLYFYIRSRLKDVFWFFLTFVKSVGFSVYFCIDVETHF